MLKRLSVAIILATFLSGCTTFSGSSHQYPKEGSVLDATTTYIALEQGGTELNPLLSWGSPVEAALASIGLKYGVKYVVVEYTDPPEGVAKEDYAMAVDAAVESAGVAAAGWNAAVAIGSAHPVIGLTAAVVSGMGYWYYRDHHYREMKEETKQ